MKQLLYILPVILFIACNTSVEKPETEPQKPVEIVKVDSGVLKQNKAHIDSLFKYALEKEITIYVKLKGSDSLIRVAAKDLPEDIETSINIFRDNLGHVIRIAENPYNDNDDVFISCTHYFDESGKTFAFEKHTNSFNCNCTEGVLFETKTEYFDQKFAPVDFTYKLVDERDKPMIKDSCRIVDYKYTVQSDVNAYNKNKAIPSR